MKFFAGIDAGQSSTTAVIGDEAGTILGLGAAGPADENGEDAISTRLRDALEGAVAKAKDNARLPPDSAFEAVVAGISGYDGKLFGQPPRFHSINVQLLHDAPVAHAGAFNGNPGVLVVAGTGSVAYGVDANGKDVTIGGWGYLFGDEGSAFWIARSAIQQAIDLEEGGKTRDPLIESVRKHFHSNTVQEMTREFYRREIARNEIAAFAKQVLELAADGDARCIKIARTAAQDLAQLAAACAKRVAGEHIAFTGGLLQNAWFSGLIDSELSMPRVAAAHPPAWGALLLAYRNACVVPVPRLRVHDASLGMTT